MQTPDDFAQPDSGEAATEVDERVKGKQPTLGERERLQHALVFVASISGQPGLKIQAVLANERLYAQEIGRRMLADHDVHTPPAGEPRHELAANQAMKLENELIVERSGGEFAVFDALFELLNVAREVRS